MGKALRCGITFVLGAVLMASGGLSGLADSALEETKQLLQKSLTLYEIDQEIARLSVQEEKIGQEIRSTEERLDLQQKEVASTREHAGKVLRAYYMGDRDHIWMLLFSAKSITDALSVYEYLNMILQNDQRSLTAYADSYRSLQGTLHDLESTQAELQEVKGSFIAQREKVAALQKEIDAQLQNNPEADDLVREMDRFTKEWQEKGIPLFRSYLSAISTAMQSLPELLTGDQGSKFIKNANLAQKSMEFEIGDTELNEFFRSKNPLFANMSFRFEDGSFIASGKENGVEVSIAGRYTVENDPANKLQFHVEKLTFNGYILPETSNRALEQEFDLGFTPGTYVKGLNVTEVTLKSGKLNLKLKLK